MCISPLIAMLANFLKYLNNVSSWVERANSNVRIDTYDTDLTSVLFG